MPNEDYSPSNQEETVLELFKSGRDTDAPWGRLNPLYIREQTDLEKGQVENALQNLRMAGWIDHLNNGGLYELVADPRETTDIDTPGETDIVDSPDQTTPGDDEETQPTEEQAVEDDDKGGLIDRLT